MSTQLSMPLLMSDGVPQIDVSRRSGEFVRRSVMHEACHLPTLIPLCPSVDLMEISCIQLNAALDTLKFKYIPLIPVITSKRKFYFVGFYFRCP